jgi:hypothetical protein
MSTTIFDDDFSSYTPGSNNITGFGFPFGPGGVVVDFGTMTGSSPAPGFYERLGQGYGLNGSPMVHQETTAVSDTQIVWASFPPLNNALLGFANCSIAVDNADLAAGTGAGWSFTNLASVQFNSDYTISLVVAGTAGVLPFATTTQQACYLNVWQYYQVDFNFSQITVGTNLVLQVIGTLAVNGTLMCSGTGISNVLISSLPTGTPVTNQWRWTSGGILADITGYVGVPLPAIGTFPHPAATIDALYTQGVVELARVPSVRHGRVTQGSVELLREPSSSVRHARMTQGVVELMRRPVRGTWYIYEA